MVLLDYKKVKSITLLMIGFLPMFFMTLAIGGLRLTWIGGAAAGVFALIVLLIIGNDLLSKNAWVRAVEREGIMLFGLNSTGIIPTGIARIRQNKLGQKLFFFKHGNEEVTRLYDREVSWTLKEPMTGFFEILRDKETGKKKVRIELDEDSFAKSVYFTDYMQCLIFNEQAGSFITKQELGDQERDKQITYLTLNEQRELRELNATLNNFIRNYADRLNEVVGGIIGSTAFKVIIVIIILLVIGALCYMYVPGVQEAINGVPKAVSGIIPTGQPKTPILR